SHGDADALLDLLPDAERRLGDELVRRLVEQEDRARVDVEDAFRALEQRLEQLTQMQMGQRCIGYRLQPPDMLRGGTLRPHTGAIPAEEAKLSAGALSVARVAADDHRRSERQTGERQVRTLGGAERHHRTTDESRAGDESEQAEGGGESERDEDG